MPNPGAKRFLEEHGQKLLSAELQLFCLLGRQQGDADLCSLPPLYFTEIWGAKDSAQVTVQRTLQQQVSPENQSRKQQQRSYL